MKENPKYNGIFVDAKNNPIEGAKEFFDWKSRSIASAVLVMAETGNGGYVFLTTKRGPKCPDNIGKLVFTCGYLNWDETVAEGAAREVYEETGYRISPKDLMFAGFNDQPTENRQNVTFRWIALVDYDELAQALASGELNTNTASRGGEDGECDEVKLMAFTEIKSNPEKFAFNHGNLAQTIVENLDGIKKMNELIKPLIPSMVGE